MKEPFYYLDYTSGECLFKIYLNEVLIVDNIQGQKSPAGNLLLNTFIYKSGLQNIRFEVFSKKGEPALNDNSFIEVYLYKADQATGFDKKVDIIARGTKLPHELLFNDGKLLIPPISWIINFEAEVTYSLEKHWDKVKDISSISNYKDLVIAAYTEIYQLVKEGNSVKLFELMKGSFNRTNTTLFENEKGENYTLQMFENLLKRQEIAGGIYQYKTLILERFVSMEKK